MIIALRLIHILAGSFWVGALLFVAGFLMPAVRASGAAGGAVMGQLMRARKLPQFMMTAGVLTLLSGFGLVYVLAGSTGLQWFTIGPGRAIGIGAVLTIAAMTLGLAVNMPTARRLARIAAELQKAGRPPTAGETARVEALQARLNRAAAAAAILLVGAAACMAVARYVA